MFSFWFLFFFFSSRAEKKRALRKHRFHATGNAQPILTIKFSVGAHVRRVWNSSNKFISQKSKSKNVRRRYTQMTNEKLWKICVDTCRTMHFIFTYFVQFFSGFWPNIWFSIDDHIVILEANITRWRWIAQHPRIFCFSFGWCFHSQVAQHHKTRLARLKMKTKEHQKKSN